MPIELPRFEKILSILARFPRIHRMLGRGGIDYSKILAAAQKLHITSIFVEQEPPFKEMPALEAVKVDYEYLHRLNV
jgi:hypothetical protein